MNLKTNLISHWKLDETSGTRNDSHGSNHLTDNNTVGSAAGKLGNAASFIASNSESLSVTSNSTLQIGDIDFTIGGWVYLTDVSHNCWIASKDNPGTSGAREYVLGYSGSSQKFLFAVFKATDSAVSVTSTLTTPTLAINTWYFIVGWHDSVSDTIYLQVNGGVPDSQSTGGSLQTASTADFDLGASALGENYTDGNIDSVSFWKRTLTSAERKALYNSGDGLGYSDFDAWDGTLNQDLISHWKLNEASGTRIDSHGSNDLTDNNTVGSATGKLGNAAVFVSANVESLSHVDNSDLSVSGSFTFAMWYYATVSGLPEVLVAKANLSDDEEYLLYKNGSDLISFFVYDSVSGSVNADSAAISLNTWYFIVAEYDHSTKKARLYINNGAPIESSSTLTNQPNDGTTGFYLGQTSGGSFSSDGYLDSVSYWKRVLTSAERRALYNSSNALDYENFSQWVGSLKHNLISHWQLDETGGTRADIHGSNDLTDNNTVGSAAGKIGTAADFERDNSEYLTITDNADLSLTSDSDFTFALWLKSETKDVGSRCILQKSDDFINAPLCEYELYHGAGGLLAFAMGNGTTSAGVTGSTLVDGTWIFVVCWYSALEQKIYMQCDNGTPASAAWTGGVQNTAKPFAIGGFTGGGFYFDGLIDSVSFWKRKLTSAERRALYNSGNGLDYSGFNLWQGTLKQDLISHWKLEEASGTRFDAHGNNDLTDNNTVTNAAGKIGNAANFVRANTEWLSDTTPEPLLQVKKESDWTFAMWAYPNTTNVTYRIAQWTGAQIIRINNNGPDYIQAIYGASNDGPSVTIGAWNFVVVKWNAATGTLSIRVNNGTASTFVVTGVDATEDFLLSSTLDPLDGLIDSTSFWARQLTPTEETTLYNAGAGLDYDAFVSGGVTLRRRRIIFIS